MNEKMKEEIQALIKTLIDKMGVLASVDINEIFDTTQFVIKSKDAGILIGINGANLKAFNHVVRRMSEKISGSEKGARFSVDVNDYQKQRIDSLHELAKMSAQRVRYFKKDVEMESMNAFDRRIIHSALAEYPDIVTESTGEGMNRRVVIKPL
ncbi:MAG: hypothetical protein COU46_02870 [Candidatus Niyogibacteria bacterium CG10_big_fil_rev_8_21_14_0_10_42_19]|uniref:R3H domain-containing protein n=1 Tax=Candidatus Niyogibacteria bacterium CG10_big_fil_rev_8_21_14_0_10_42_19 TaxID=1974725 RepID=A0A2H0TH91_9BACT|nr:MAG: hypothetical protein COU46_02870 [Candidatus Niyogibacteria bacterium CG10_big_fil_rev_8_21_14_0_10_42_19]